MQKTIYYPEGLPVRTGDIVWNNEGVNVRKVISIVTEEEAKQVFVADGVTDGAGFFWSRSIGESDLGILGFESKESFEEEKQNDDFSWKTMLMLAIATAIDALAVGVTFSFESINIFMAISIIGLTTFIIASAGVYIGHIFGNKYQQKAQITGGIILILIGVKILIEGLGII